jgi:hypothetical protein
MGKRILLFSLLVIVLLSINWFVEVKAASLTNNLSNPMITNELPSAAANAISISLPVSTLAMGAIR